MKKIVTSIALVLVLGSCSVKNIDTSKDNISIPITVTQLAESKRELLAKDTTGIVKNVELEDDNYVYQYSISKEKVELDKRIQKEYPLGAFLLLGALLGMAVVGLISSFLK